MRPAVGTVDISENVVVKKIVVKEDFSHYSVNKKIKTIDVVVDKIADDETIVSTEYYHFDSVDYIESPDELQLWNLVDKKRGILNE